MPGLRDVDFGALAGDVGGEAVDLQHNVVGLLLDKRVHAAAGGSKAHVALLVGEGDIKKGQVRMEGLPAPLVHLAQMDRGEVRPPRFPGPPLLIPHKIRGDAKGLGMGAVQNRHGRNDVGAPDGDILQLLRPGGQGVGDGSGIAGAAAQVDLLAALDQGGGLLGGNGFGAEFLL